jgi:hypothetical protein
VQGFRLVGRDIGYVSSRAARRQERERRAANGGAMIDAAIFALVVGAIATPVSWWGLNRLS